MTADKTKPGPKGGLVLKLTDDNFIRIGDIELYLRRVEVTGSKGGRPIVSVRIIAPKTIAIQRCER